MQCYGGLGDLFLVEEKVYIDLHARERPPARSCDRRTSAPGLHLLLHQLFLRRELAELNFGHDVTGSDRADHFRLLLVDLLGLDVDPGDFPEQIGCVRQCTADEQRPIHHLN